MLGEKGFMTGGKEKGSQSKKTFNNKRVKEGVEISKGKKIIVNRAKKLPGKELKQGPTGAHHATARVGGGKCNNL